MSGEGFLKINFREREWGETLICCSTCLRIHWVLLVCAPTGVRTGNLGVSDNAPAELPARAQSEWFQPFCIVKRALKQSLSLRRRLQWCFSTSTQCCHTKHDTVLRLEAEIVCMERRPFWLMA